MGRRPAGLTCPSRSGRGARGWHDARVPRDAVPTGPVAGRRPPVRGSVPAHVVHTEALTPRMRRVVLAGDGVAAPPTGPHVKLFWAARDGRPPGTRTYTVRAWRAGRMTVDVVLHGEAGVAAPWAAAAVPGDEVEVVGTGGLDVRAAGWYLLAGDESALPGIAAVLEGLPGTARGRALVEVADATERVDLAAPPGVDVEWLLRDGRPAGTADLLDPAVRDAGFAADGFVWLAAESGVVRGLRDHLRATLGLNRRQVLAQGYWRRGQAFEG